MKVYDLNEVCELLKMNIQTVRIWIKEGKLKASKVGRKYMVTEENIKAFLEANTIEPKDIETEEKED